MRCGQSNRLGYLSQPEFSEAKAPRKGRRENSLRAHATSTPWEIAWHNYFCRTSPSLYRLILYGSVTAKDFQEDAHAFAGVLRVEKDRDAHADVLLLRNVVSCAFLEFELLFGG